MLRDRCQRGQLVHQRRPHVELRPPWQDVPRQAFSLGPHRLGRGLRQPAELENPGANPIDQPQLAGALAGSEEDVAEPPPRGGSLERRVQSVDVEAAEHPWRACGNDLSGGAGQP